MASISDEVLGIYEQLWIQIIIFINRAKKQLDNTMNRAILSVVRWEAGAVCCTDRPPIPMPAKVNGNLCNFFRFANSCVPRTRSKNMQKVLLLLLFHGNFNDLRVHTDRSPCIMRRVPSVCVNEIMAGLFLFIEAEHTTKRHERRSFIVQRTRLWVQ